MKKKIFLSVCLPLLMIGLMARFLPSQTTHIFCALDNSCTWTGTQTFQSVGQVGPAYYVNPGQSVQAAINTANPAGAGGIVYMAPGTYAGPTTIPDNTTLACLSAPVNVNMIGAWNVVEGTAATQCDLQYSAQLNLTIHNVHFVGFTFDFQRSTNGINLISSSYNIFDDVTIYGCGGTACLQITTSGSGGTRNSIRNEFNRLRILTTNQNASVGYTGIYLNGSASSAVTLNRFTGVDIVSNISCGIDLEQETDTNYFSDVQINQDSSSVTPTQAALCFNLSNPSSDIDADASSFDRISVTGMVGFPIDAGTTSGQRIIATSNQQGGPTVTAQGGASPSFLYESIQLSGGFNEIISQRITAGSIAAASGSGDLGAAESASVGKVFLGTGGTGVFSGNGAPSGNCGDGSLYLRQNAASTSTVMYVCQPANTWTAVTVP